MSSTTELYEGYLPHPHCLTVTELTHLKLLAVSLDKFFHRDRQARSKRKELRDTFQQIYRLLLSMSYVPTLA